MSLQSKAVLYDHHGNVVTPSQKLTNSIPSKKGYGLYGNPLSGNSIGSFRPRTYSLSDTEQGLDTLSRQLLVRWSREMYGQLGLVAAASKILGQYVVGSDGYQVNYEGANTEWGKEATDFLHHEWYPNCCTRGYSFDFQGTLQTLSEYLDRDGEALFVLGQPNGFPKFQVITSNRIESPTADNYVYTEGPLSGSIVTDGVVYGMDGSIQGWNVVTINNLVNSGVGSRTNTFVSKDKARLIYHPAFFDKGRGIPAISPGILSALSIQELDAYWMEKEKVFSTITYVEKTPTGEAHQELSDVLNRVRQASANGTAGLTGPAIAPNHAVNVVQGPSARYTAIQGGDIQPFSGESMSENTLHYLKRLETQILALIGVPHQLIFSPESVSGRISDAVMLNFRSAIKARQKVLDKYAKFLISWALAVAMKNGLISPNNDEDITKVFSLTHPALPDLNEGYTRAQDFKETQAGLRPWSWFCKKYNVPAPEKNIAEEIQLAKVFFNGVKEVAKETEMDTNTVVSYMKPDVVKPDLASIDGEEPAENSGEVDQKE